MPDPSPATAARQLAAVTSDVRRSLDNIGEGASRFANLGTAALAAVLGSFTAMSVTYVVTASVPGLNFMVIGPLIGVAGAAAGVLCVRGTSMSEDERRAIMLRLGVERNEQVARIHLDRMARLPSRTPQSVRDGLWAEYVAAARDLRALCLDPPLRLPRPPDAPLLAVPADEQPAHAPNPRDGDP